ncbi:MAG: TlpA family protein disulfide reductase [Rikenellaceae bacterium]|nr:TlpA family protein disulfide reductase [Rikenellaceae bacterium]
MSDYAARGAVVLVDFWASWCKPCIAEIPFLSGLLDKYGEQGLLIFGVSLDQNPEAWRQALNNHPMPWVQACDGEGWESRIPRDYGIQAIPFTVLIDGRGTIIGRNLHGHLLEEAIARAVHEP